MNIAKYIILAAKQHTVNVTTNTFTFIDGSDLCSQVLQDLLAHGTYSRGESSVYIGSTAHLLVVLTSIIGAEW